MAVKDYLRERFFPHLWCPGCGHGMVLNGLLQAVEKLGMSKNEIVMVSGIGCSARISGYVDFHTLHTIHGRALAFATGVKMSRPELNLIVPMGDGDALAIGGNHFIHAARRNIDITAGVLQTGQLQADGTGGGNFRLGVKRHYYCCYEQAVLDESVDHGFAPGIVVNTGCNRSTWTTTFQPAGDIGGHSGNL